MPVLKLTIVDAFTDRPLTGNAAGVVLDADELEPATMQAIAGELNLSETVFVSRSSVAGFRLRFFTPRMELPLAGHPTIAAVHALIESGRITLRPGRSRISVELLDGPLPVDIDADAEGRTQRIWMTQRPPRFMRTYRADPYAAALGIPISGLETDFELQTVSTGTPQLMFPVRSLHVLQRLDPDLQALAELQAAGDYLSVHVFAAEGYDPAAKAHARHFAPAAGVAEDPVTGSASGAMAAYLVQYGLVLQHRFMVEQGHIIGRPGNVYVEVDRDGDDGPITAVRVGGGAVTVIEGTLRLP